VLHFCVRCGGGDVLLFPCVLLTWVLTQTLISSLLLTLSLSLSFSLSVPPGITVPLSCAARVPHAVDHTASACATNTKNSVVGVWVLVVVGAGVAVGVEQQTA
jgi:hypothetical protein